MYSMLTSLLSKRSRTAASPPGRSATSTAKTSVTVTT